MRISFEAGRSLFLENIIFMTNDPLEKFSQEIAFGFARACDDAMPEKDCFATAYDYGKENQTRLAYCLMRLSKESGLSKLEIVDEIRAVASHMNALSYVYLVAADMAKDLLEE